MRSLKTVLGIFATLFVGSAIAFALGTPFKHFDQIIRATGFNTYTQVRGVKTVKIAVLDNGFRDYKKQIGKTLPTSTKFHAGPVPIDPASEESHGLYMAQLVAGLLSASPNVNYELHLFSAFGYSNFEAAVKKVINERFDVVLYAQVWEYGGNGDGRGFINSLVNKATSSGVLWVNASGNFGNSTFKAPVEIGEDAWVKLPGPNQSVRIRCEKTRAGKCPLRIVLSWNDFSDDVNVGSDKDLDLILTDDTLKIVSSSALQQMKKVPDGFPGGSLYPREIIQTEVDPGLYLVRVKARSSNFDSRRDALRITVSGDHVNLVDATLSETLLPPADNSNVISIGASDSDKTASSNHMRKPELSAPSLISLTNGDQFKGTSNSAAIAAAAVAVLKAVQPNIDRGQVIKLLSGESSYYQGPQGDGLPLETLEFGPKGPGCFRATALPYMPPALASMLKTGATIVETDRGIKIFTPYDPFQATGVARVSYDDMLVVSSQGFEPLPRSNQAYLPNGFFEVVQQPEGQIVCPLSGVGANPSGSRNLRLPSPQSF
jgi:hypothetical protein